MNLQQRQSIADSLNKIPFIFLTRYPADQTLKNVILQLEVEKNLFWDNWNNKWVTQ